MTTCVDVVTLFSIGSSGKLAASQELCQKFVEKANEDRAVGRAHDPDTGRGAFRLYDLEVQLKANSCLKGGATKMSCILALAMVPCMAAISDPTQQPLLHSSDITYLGSFYLPRPATGVASGSFDYGGMGLAVK